MLGSWKLTVAAAAIVLGAAAAPTVARAQAADTAAQVAPTHKHKHPLFRGITLTTDQRSQLKAIRAKYRPQIREARQNNDRATIKQLHGQMVGEARGVLTPDQQTQFDNNLQALKARKKAHSSATTPPTGTAQPAGTTQPTS